MPKKTAPALLTVRGISRTFGDRTILDGVDLDVAEGEAVGVVGPNGSGKSTLLRCIVGADEADAGEAELTGRALDEREPSIRRDLAVVMDDLDFFPDLSVVEHLDLVARAHAQPDAEEIVNVVLDEVGLMEVSGQLPSTLSSGQRRRLALASAFVRPRLLLVLDEPEARLDVGGVHWLGEKLVAEKAAGRGILLVSHDPDLVERVCDRVVRLGPTADDT
ncbi:ABC transporter ATP-binding protein [Nocardioides sp. Root122]|uniref:ABC transporter ATP-binding protein n=1 Tax=Nocardioides TaxID=1839 RepID=UPI0007029986|nr:MULTISPECIES: ABC transporter ATP-binding protein [Nocardioides]KQV65936.1 ABC transporter ATP-binding protein [Nocardioides sp. Root122]MCK9823128.1 ABC transporter ATP-binding protein [Nocardioides cavernae]